MRKRIYIPLLAVALLALLASPVLAINFGQRDDGEHPYVGLMLFPLGDGSAAVCSGTLVDPGYFMTAGHCADPGGTVWITFEEVPTFPIGGPTWFSGTFHRHPDFDDFASFPAIHDVAIVVLDSPVSGIDPARIAPLGYLESYQNQKGLQDTIFVPVGYGLQSRKPTFEWDLARYKGEHRIINLVSYNNGGYNVQLTNNPGKGNGEGGTCSGDSGGPILHDGDMVVAINSFGLAPHCKGNDFAFRVDIPDAQDFISQFLPLEP